MKIAIFGILPFSDLIKEGFKKLDHEISNELKPFYLNDEIYHNLELEPSSKPFLLGKIKETDEEHIIAWTYEIGKGKVVYNSLGHDSKSLESDEFSEIIRRSINWIEGKNNEWDKK